MGNPRCVADKQNVKKEKKRGKNQYVVKSTYLRYMLLILLSSEIMVAHADSAGTQNAPTELCSPSMDRCPISLGILCCDNCRLQEFPRVGPVINASTIRKFYLSENSISKIVAGCFEDFDNLEVLHLDNNKLTCLEGGTFLGASSLKLLEIHWNMIFAIQSGTFDGLSKLEELHLDNNKIEYLPDGIFSDMAMLKHLMLQSNKLHDRSLPKGLLKNLTSLEVLHMSRNRLTTLPSDFFQGLNRLKKVFLNNNLFTAVNMQQWPNVEYQLVDLKDNPLIGITNVPKRIVELKASLNYLECTCENERALVLILKQGIASSHCANLSCISQTVTTLTVLEETRQLGMPPPSSAPSHSYWSYTWLYLSVILTCNLL